MPSEASETLFSPTTWLWLVAAVASAAVLFGSMNRRRTRLTETLRDYVQQNQPDAKEISEDSDQGSND
jgi:hypothetical protein